MGDYNRSTKQCSFNELRSELAASILQHIEKHELEAIEPNILICCETTNELKKFGFIASLMGRLTGRFPHGDLHHTAAVVTSEMLFFATHSLKQGAVVWHAKLTDIEVKEYQFKHMIEDTGLSVFGLIGFSRERNWAFIGLGEEPAAKKLETTLREAIEHANHPV